MESGLIAIIRSKSADGIVEAAQAIATGGINAIEVTLTTPGALDSICALRSMGHIRIGAGTILEVEDAHRAIEAGAEFIVTPTLQPETIACCREHQIPIVCGCLTPTEAYAAFKGGADLQKLFPAENLGPKYIRALLAPMPFLKIVPTGGVNLENLHEFFDAGCGAVGLGSNLATPKLLAGKDWDGLTGLARQYADRLGEWRKGA